MILFCTFFLNLHLLVPRGVWECGRYMTIGSHGIIFYHHKIINAKRLPLLDKRPLLHIER